MADFTFTRATKSQQKARIALAGPSGSGKTWSALSIATGLGQSVAVIDTERGSASKYAGDFTFDTCPMYTYDPRDLPKALSAAAAAEYEVVIVDSLSHFWMGQGGMLEQVDNVTKRSSSGNSFGGWKEMRPAERAMIDALLAYPGHLLVTMRTKTEWVITENERGRKEPKKIGTKPEQREGIEYEFDLVGDLDHEHTLIVSKSRIATLSDEVIARPGPDLGMRIRDWLMDGVKLPTVREYLEQLDAATDAEQVRELYRAVMARNLGAAPCTNASGEAATLIALITERGAMLGGRVAPAPAQAPPGQVQRSKAAPEDDPWATQPDAATTSDAAAAQEPSAQQPAASVPEQLPAEPPKANPGLLKAVHTALTKSGVKSGADHLAALRELTGRDLTTSNDLTVEEARHVLAVLAKPKPAGPPEGWTEQDGDQLAADLMTACFGAHSEHELAEVGAQIAAAVNAGKITEPDRLHLRAAYKDAQLKGANAAQQQPEPVGAPA